MDCPQLKKAGDLLYLGVAPAKVAGAKHCNYKDSRNHDTNSDTDGGPMVIAAGPIGSAANFIASWSGAAWSCGLRAKPPFLLAGEGVPKQNAKSGGVPYIAPRG